MLFEYDNPTRYLYFEALKGDHGMKCLPITQYTKAMKLFLAADDDLICHLEELGGLATAQKAIRKINEGNAPAAARADKIGLRRAKGLSVEIVQQVKELRAKLKDNKKPWSIRDIAAELDISRGAVDRILQSRKGL